MTHRSWNTIARAPASLDALAVVFVFLATAWCLWSASGKAGDDVPGPLLTPPSRTSIKNDLGTVIQIKRTLDRDEELAPKKLNLYVHVTSGVARLSGPVPSEEVRRRVIQVVAQVPGVLKVRSDELYFAKPHEKTKPLVLPSADDKPTRTQSASPNPASAAPGTLTGREPVAETPPRVHLRAPEAVSLAPANPNPTVLTTHPRTPSPATSLASVIEDLRRRDARFGAIRTEVQGKMVRVFAGNADGESVMAFAQALTRLPGVERVVVRESPSASR
jgi:hypothetical protein